MKEKRKVISIKNLNKVFDVKDEDVHVLKNINLDVYSGEFVIIFGPSGCGKSTLLNTIVGLEAPTSGEIKIRGENLYHKNDDERARFRGSKFGIIYQQPNWIKALNVLENVAFPLHINRARKGNAEKRAIKMLEMFKLEKYQGYIPTELSGGQQQKLAMCRSLITNPWMIIADEPTGNLDTNSAGDLMYIFEFINTESKRTIIMVSHNTEYERFATKVVYMEDGQIKQIVNKKEVEVTEKEENKDLLELALGGDK